MAQLIQRCFNCTLSRRLVPSRPILHIPACFDHTIYEPDRKGRNRDAVQKLNVKDHYRLTGLIWPEVKLFAQEMKEKFLSDGYYMPMHDDYEYFWKFSDPSTYDKWIVTSDSDLFEGFSTGELSVSKSGCALFHGNLSTGFVDDGFVKRAGYVSMRSPRNRKSFHRHEPYDWTRHTHLVLRVRGDGRSYQIVLQMARQYDTSWNDQYNYKLFTRGGPYWQTAKIPLSKFFHSHKGRLQDTQEPLARYLHTIRSLGLTIADDTDGPFQLEIDYIALLRDENHQETFAYELYDAKWSEIQN